MKVTLLTQDQLWGDDTLSAIKEYGVKAGMTDLAVFLGVYLNSSNTTSDGLRSGRFWSASANTNGNVRVACSDGAEYWDYANER